MKSFIKKIFNKETDESIHNQFTRFGKGNYEKRAALKLHKTADKIKLKASFEFANDFILLACELSEKLNISGIILSKKDISDLLKQSDIQAVSEEKKGGLFFKNNIDEQEVSSDLLKKVVEESYFSLLDVRSSELNLKIKKSLPKPGKSGEGKIDFKFCQFETYLKNWEKIKQGFFWDIEGKKAEITHDFIIDKLIYPKDEKDFAMIRLKAKRKGKVKRNCVVDKKELNFEVDFEA